ncbi:hypothetical protein JCM17846_20240 [Iodidimonas nitroreducens]|uniref:Inner membrane protein YgaP-like transmembrane domain-containing protein n=1 Tax=Iodidimonas nitroreducens TaxID=1236968 RepID=A0A5A7N7N3_9PROT|nr:DUF2892 domain-containing protein [Iodidimonas nitroreducens]GAK33228.1 hypothetical protein AQ1_01115 [alpha proteobacterium Q-1]GER04342.1 hypothetical protein JCM17846_20240 [Iodidimonas nitroreducens]
MKKNMGTLDRILRLIAAIALGILVYSGVISGTLAVVLTVVVAVFLLTSLVSFCPLYRLLGQSTCSRN